EGLESRARRADIDVTIERAHRLAQREVARRPGTRTPEMAREKPVGRPLAEAADGDDPLLHVFVREESKPGQVEVGAREPDDVLGLAPREPERDELLLGRRRYALSARKGPDATDRLSQPLDEPVADRDRRIERDLLRGDRGEQRLERVWGERRSEAGEGDDGRRERLLGGRPRGGGDEGELEADQPADHR